MKYENKKNTPPHNRNVFAIKFPWTKAMPNKKHTRVPIYFSYQ